MKIHAVIFDLDDTLIVDEAVSKETFARVAELAGKQYGADTERFVRDAMRHARSLWAEGPSQHYCKSLGISAFECLWGRFEGGDADLTQLREWAHVFRERVFDTALREQLLESQSGACDLAEAFARERRRLQRLMPDAREILARLATEYKLGMLTNGAPDLQREKITASGLGGCFQAIAISGEYGVGKPKPEIFHRLAAEIGVETTQAVMVGNSLERDIAGARNAGMASIWIKVPGSEEHDDAQPDRTITALAELPGVLTSLEAVVAS